MKSFVNFFKILILSLFLSGCNQISFFYDYADWYIMYKIDDYFDITDAQEDFLDPKIDQLHAWHRKEEVPRIIKFLEQVKIEVKNGFSEKNLPWIENEYKKMRMRINQKLGDDMALFLSSLNTEQIRYFEKKLEESNREHDNRPERSYDEWLERRQNRTIDRLEDWYGDLTEKQKKAVLSNIKFVRQDHASHNIQRRELQKRIIKLLYKKKTTNEIRDYVTNWFMDPSIFSTTDYNEEIEKRKTTWMDYWIKLNQILTQKQKQHALNKLQDYIDDLKDINNSREEYVSVPKSANLNLDHSQN